MKITKEQADKVIAALEAMASGLEWFRDMYPKEVNEDDHVMIAEKDEALSIMRGLAEDAEPVGRRVKAEAIHCPVCGFYCLGKGGKTCIDKPALVAAPSPQEAQTEAQEREAFEAWVSREDYSLGTDPIDGEYLFADTHHAWTGFKAGRAGSKP